MICSCALFCFAWALPLRNDIIACILHFAGEVEPPLNRDSMRHDLHGHPRLGALKQRGHVMHAAPAIGHGVII